MNWPRFDLHTHTNASDGVLSPTELVTRAAAAGVAWLAVTDHDTVAALPEAKRAARVAGIGLIPGVELSTVWRGIGIHVVGLGIDASSPVLQAGLAAQQQARVRRARMIADKLVRKGLPDLYEAAVTEAGAAEVGRPHFARCMVRLGLVRSWQEAFKKYLGAGKAGDIKCQWAELPEVVRWIHAAGGLSVLAHPLHYNLTRTKLKALLQAFKASGGAALEVSNGSQNRDVTRDLARLAAEYELLASAGSDFHAPADWLDLGRYTPVPPGCALVLDALITEPRPRSTPAED